MALEDLTGDKYIDALVSANPVGTTDSIATVDNHIRGIKNVLKKTFPNLTGIVLATQNELNNGYRGIAQNTKTFFYQASAPSGWTQTTTLNDKMIRLVSSVGAGIGGAWAITGHNLAATVLSAAQMPSHQHTGTTTTDGAHTHTVSRYAYTGPYVRMRGAFFAQTLSNMTVDAAGAHSHTSTTSSIGNNQGHSHTLTHDGNWRPAYIDIIACTKN